MKAHDHSLTAEQLLEKVGVKTTSNRILVLRKIIDSELPLSLVELETELETLDRSSVLRVLNILLDHNIVHAFEDGRGVSKYEICHGESHCTINDMHAHFYCEKCDRVYCFEEISAPHINIPDGFRIRSLNYMLKGICPKCAHAEE